MERLELVVEQDHIERLTSATPLAALSELVWNSYDAGAKNVDIRINAGNLTNIESIEVSDDGSGLSEADAKEQYRRIGGSWKKLKRTTDDGRPIHGEKGQGRLKAFSLGDSVVWRYARSGKIFEISGHRNRLKHPELVVLQDGGGNGCRVTISEIQKDFRILSSDGFDQDLETVFALHLYNRPDFNITYDGIKLDPSSAIVSVQKKDFSVPQTDGHSVSGNLTIIEWNTRIDRKIMLCHDGGFPFYELVPGNHAPGFVFTAHVTCPVFQVLKDENREQLAEHDSLVRAVIDAVKDDLRDHFRLRETGRARERIESWKSADIYPYRAESPSPVERKEREVFDIVALTLAEHSKDFDRSADKQKKLILELMKAAVENDSGSLPDILGHVIDLPVERREELSNLLKRTSLPSMIEATKAVVDRLDFIRGLQILLFNPVSKKQLLERSQLHKILQRESWIFGERYNLVNSDKDLNAVLEKHKLLLGRARGVSINERVLDEDGKTRIVDLMLSARIPTATNDQRKHLVIEIKRPTQKVDDDVCSQIRKYARAVALDERFKGNDVEWDFYAISNEISDGVALEVNQDGKPTGLLLELGNPKIRVWVKTWGQVIAEAEGRLTFYQRQLAYEADEPEALRYLSKVHRDYLSPEVRKQIEELEKEDS